jgi:hypothetical protein
MASRSGWASGSRIQSGTLPVVPAGLLPDAVDSFDRIEIIFIDMLLATHVTAWMSGRRGGVSMQIRYDRFQKI